MKKEEEKKKLLGSSCGQQETHLNSSVKLLLKNASEMSSFHVKTSVL